MKAKTRKKIQLGLVVAALGCLSCGVAFNNGMFVQADAAGETIFECPGASIRMNKQDGLNGIRFPMFMDTDTFEDLTDNATIKSEDVTFGTLIIPTDKLTGTLNINTALAKNLVTYGYNANDEFVNVWTECTDEDYPDCMQGYAYIHSIPDTSLDRNLTAVGYYTTDGGASYTYTTPVERNVSYVADKAINSGDYTEEQVTKLHDFLADYTITFETGADTQTKAVKYGKTYDFPAASVSVPAGSVLGWYDETGARMDIRKDVIALKNATYTAKAVENVTYTTTIHNKDNVFKGDPSVTYKDGYYYLITEDSKSRLWVTKSVSLEDLLNGGYNGWSHPNAVCIYTPDENSTFGAEAWAPELTYIQGKWYIYVSGVEYGKVHKETNMKMFVLECESQDPTGEWKDPVRLSPKGFNSYYTIDGHAFEYKGQLYYVFSGQKEGWFGSLGEDRKPYLYMTKMLNPTTIDSTVTPVNISKGSDLEEGPCTIVDGDDVYLMYSAGTWNGGDIDNSKDYHLEYYKLTGTNLLSSNSWTEMGTCLEHDAEKDIYAVGHNHIFKIADGSLWTSYHGIVGTEDAGTSAYLAKRRAMVQPISIVNGALEFGGIQDTVTITDKAGLQYYNEAKTEYFVDGYGWAKLWENDGKSFTASTTVRRLSGSDQYCAGITLYERANGKTNKLLIGVEMEGNLFFCKDYIRNPFYYNYEGYQWGNESEINLTVNYKAGDSTATSTLTIVVANRNNSKSKTFTYTLDQINAMMSDAISGETKAFDFTFTGDFEIGLGGNQNQCVLTNVSFGVTRYNVTFVDVYGRKTVTTYDDGATLNVPEIIEREGYEFLGWAEKQADGSYDEPCDINGLTVTANTEYVARYSAVGPTYVAPAIDTVNPLIKEHGSTYGRHNDANITIDSGAYFFEDEGIAYGSSFMMKTTIAATNKGQVGFVMSAQSGYYLQIVVRPTEQNGKGDVYLWSDGTKKKWLTVNLNEGVDPFGANNDQALEMGLIYRNGTYYVFFDGVLACQVSETKDDGGWGNTAKTAIGTGDKIRLGLTARNGQTSFSDTMYSTDADVIEDYYFNDSKLKFGNNIYTSNDKEIGRNADGKFVLHTETGAVFFKDVEIEQNQAFVIYATLDSLEDNPDGVGFAVGTLGENNSAHMMFNWRANDIYVTRESGHGWRGYDANPSTGISLAAPATMALVYKDGYYYMFINGAKIASFDEDGKMGSWQKYTVQSTIGTEGTKKIGLSVLSSKATFSDWGYSTDASVISSYFKYNVTFIDEFGGTTTQTYIEGQMLIVPEIVEREGYEFLGWAEKQSDGSYGEPGEIADLTVMSNREFVAQYKEVEHDDGKIKLGSNIYTSTDKELGVNSDGNYVLHTEAGAVFFEGVEIEQNQNFVIYATIDSLEDTPNGVGFVVGTLGTNNSSHMMFNWRTSDIYVTRENNYVDGSKVWGWRGYDSNPATGISQAAPATMALVYKDGIYYMFINGEQIASFDEDGKMGSWQTYTVQSTIGTEGTKKIGLSVISAKATFSAWGYSTDENEVAKYFPPELGSNIYTSTDKELGINSDGNYVLHTEVGAVFFEGVEIEQNQNFVIYATIDSLEDTPNGVGFVVGTLGTNNSSHMMFNWRTSDIYVTRENNYVDGSKVWGWRGYDSNPATGISQAAPATMALVYKDGIYYMFINGEQIASFDEDGKMGSWQTYTVQSTIGTEGTKKIGLSVTSAKATFSAWGYSTDKNEVAKYFN